MKFQLRNQSNEDSKCENTQKAYINKFLNHSKSTEEFEANYIATIFSQHDLNINLRKEKSKQNVCYAIIEISTKSKNVLAINNH